MIINYSKEFNEIIKELEKARNILIVAHSAPDGDTIGSAFSLKEYLMSDFGKKATVTCADALPQYLKDFLENENIEIPENLNLQKFDLILGCDAVERGFEKIVMKKEKNQKIILLDHHTTLRMKTVKPDIVISDERYSSVCEILFDFFDFHRIEINRKISEYLLLGILGDTGIFQHANTTPKVMEMAASLMRRGASLTKIIRLVFKNKRLETLKLWGRAMERAEINPKTGAIMSYVTKQDLEDLHGNAEELTNPRTEEPDTEHSIFPVPFWYIAPNNQRQRSESEIMGGKNNVRGILSDVAPTVLSALKLQIPPEMTGQNLLEILK